MAYRSEHTQWLDEINGTEPFLERLISRHGGALAFGLISLAILAGVVLAMVR